MELKQFGKLLQRRVDKDFDRNRALAGRWWGCSGTLVALVIMGERAPSPAMLEYCGYERIKSVDKYVRVKGDV
jgi:hypothetical protein